MADPSDILSADRLAEIGRKLDPLTVGMVRPDDMKEIAEALLRHLRALAAPADGEALGRRARLIFHGAADESELPTWEGLSDDKRADYCRIGAAHHALGYAAGALSREGEIAALRASFDRLSRDHETVCREASADRRALEAAQAVCDDRKTTIARLTAELAEARTRIEQGIAGVAIMKESHAEALATARADGAREEREAAQAEIAHLTAERDALQRHYDAAGSEHNLLALLDLYHARMTEARTESESLSAQLTTARANLERVGGLLDESDARGGW